MLVGQAVALEALEALEALALLLSSTLGLISLALALVLSSTQHCQALKLKGIGAACSVCYAKTADWIQKLQGSMFARMVQVWVPLVHSPSPHCFASMHWCCSCSSSSMPGVQRHLLLCQ